MPSNHLILSRPLLLPPSIFPSIRVFSNESVLHIRRPKYWSFSFSPSNEYSGLISFNIDWLDLLANIILDSKNLKLFLWDQEQDKNIHSHLFFFLLCCATCRILISWSGIKPVPPAVEAQSLNHWTARKSLLSPFLFNTVLEVLATNQTRNKRHSNWKSSKTIAICRWHNTIYRRLYHKTMRINEFSKVAWHKTNIQEFVAFLYTNNEVLEGEIQETILPKRIKYLGINITKEVKDQYSKHYHGLEELVWLKFHTIQSNLQIQFNLYQNTHSVLHMHAHSVMSDSWWPHGL